MKGVFVFYKPKNWTSFDVIRVLKKRFPHEKIGHGGTLDPAAEGVLVIAIGKENTKKLHQVLKNNKKDYIATIVLGLESDTYDITGIVKKIKVKSWPHKKDIVKALKNFEGEFLQTPPLFSAIKIFGTPAYKLARQGKNPTIKSKKVRVFDIKLLSYKNLKNSAKLKIGLTVGSGFYIRSFANDLGRILKTGGVLEKLVRTRVGKFSADMAIHINKF